ncbi:MAG TPA: M48 family metallopeptidase, partial [Bacteroidia bacterium]|nr:M48 family metallopeptidase [Bacteroidia bacterium]
MKKVYWFTFLFTLSFRLIFSQTNYQHGFLPVDADEKKSQPNYDLYKQQLHKKYDTLFERVEDCNKFIKWEIADLRSNFEDGENYTNWDYAQTYINKLFKTIIPGANPDSVNMKIIRSTNINAFMTGSGQAYITVGFLANALNEAEIASVLGHEYGHYIHLDAYKGFKDYIKTEKKIKIGNTFAGYGGGIFSLMSISNMYDARRDMEREADKTGIELAKQAGYNLLAAVDMERRFKLIEDNAVKDKDYKRRPGFYFRTHPPSKERVEYAQKAANASDTVNTKYFQVDENMFNKVKMQAVDECINLLLQQMDYEDCIELCYKQLLFYPTDEFYLFYLNEALRRLILINPKEADNFFITGQYNTAVTQLPKSKLPVYINSQTPIKNTDFRIPRTIFYHYEYLMLADNNKVFVTLPNNYLTRTDTLEFVTNSDALKYFIALQEKLNQSSVSWVKNCQTNT